MSLKRYLGKLMYAAYIPFSIDAPDEEAALAELRKRTPERLSEAEKTELLFHLERTAKADMVTVLDQPSNNESAQEPRNAPKINRTFRVRKQKPNERA